MENPCTVQGRAEHPARARVALLDCLFLTLVVLLSLALYVRGLGFYADDWSLLAIMRFPLAGDQSLPGLYRTLYAMTPQGRNRPVEFLYYALMYKLSGTDPLGYHLVNSLMLTLMILLFYASLSELGRSRLISLGVPATYALLPHYSTVRFWMAAFQINLSMALYFLSLYSDLRALRARPVPLVAWKSLAVLGLLGSTLAYEGPLPLFLLNPLLVWYHARRLYGPQLSGPDKRGIRTNVVAAAAVNLLALAAVVAYKSATATRLIGTTRFIDNAARLVKGAVVVSYVDYGLFLPRVMRVILRDYFDGSILAAGGVLGVIIFGYLYYSAARPEAEWPAGGDWLALLVSGIVVFGLGFVIFLTAAGFEFAKTGPVNRIAIASTVGVAMSLVGVLGLACSLLPSSTLRGGSFCLALALLGACGFTINNTTASFYVDAYHREREIIADIRARFPVLPAGSTLILDGSCQYVGPAHVFESCWDLAGALTLAYGGQPIRADVVNDRTHFDNDYIYTILYAVKQKYEYSDNMIIYNLKNRQAYRMDGAEAARRYFRDFPPGRSADCPWWGEGYGSWVF